MVGRKLVEERVITSKQLKKAKKFAKRTGQRLRKVLVEMDFISEEQLVSFLHKKMGLPRLKLENRFIDTGLIKLIPEKLARKYHFMPVSKSTDKLTCAMLDPWDINVLDELKMITNLTVKPVVATEMEIRKAIDENYKVNNAIKDAIDSIDEKKVSLSESKEKDEDNIGAEIMGLVDLIIEKAIKNRASDIHIEPEEKKLETRFRIDGILYEISSFPKNLQATITARIKIMAGLNISEKRLPQDGRFTFKKEEDEIDIRVSCVPTIYGENVVLRLFDVSATHLHLEKLGFVEGVLKKYQSLITQPHGIILVTGPTGSGKTTTLYAALNKLNTVDKNIITIEDPVEYKLSRIRQIQIKPKIDLTFANGLRSVLRQDPDIIMVGEMRDFETASIAIQSALTGHLVFSTLHTNDSAGAVTRMVDMGIKPYLISSAVIGVLAQRLVRKICPECKEKYKATKVELQDLGIESIEELEFFRGRGCENCRHTGYTGRIGIFELLILDKNIRKMISKNVLADEIERVALDSGMVTLLEDGINKIKSGITTVEEVLRVTQEGKNKTGNF